MLDEELLGARIINHPHLSLLPKSKTNYWQTHSQIRINLKPCEPLKEVIRANFTGWSANIFF